MIRQQKPRILKVFKNKGKIMQENLNPAMTEQQQFIEFKRLNRMKEAKASVLKIECDCLSAECDKVFLKDICRRANSLELGAIVVYPAFVKPCVSFLGGDPKVSLVASVSCPHGADTTEIKVAAVKRAVKDGVDEVEVFAPVTLIKDGNWQYFKRECKKLKKAAKIRALRIVFDCKLLTEKELTKACNVAADVGVNCLRLSGADGDLITTVKTALKGKCLIKADGAGDLSTFLTYCNAGADTVGCTRAFDMASYMLKSAEEE